MSKVAYNERHKEVLDSLLLKMPAVSPGKMFGYPAYYVHGRLFACVHGEHVVIKIPELMAQTLMRTRAKTIRPFQAMGNRTMREWITISRKDSRAYLRDKDTFRLSIKFVGALVAKG